MEAINYWRLCDQLTILQAALLVIDIDPSSEDGYVENWQVHERPHGYEAAKTAISNSLRKGDITGDLIPEYEHDINGNQSGPIEGTININCSTVDVESLKQWLSHRGFTSGFFFPTTSEVADYLNHEHECFSPKLAAAIHAWKAVSTDPMYKDNGKHVKQNLSTWLRSHAGQFGLLKEDGEINEDAINNQIAKVANWQDKGGAPKTPSR